MKAAIISAGTINDYARMKKYAEEADYIICADGGFNHAERMGITPDLTVGDFDSWRGDISGEVVRLNPEKDYTDTHIAVMEALGRGYRDITILGGSGTRLDHTLSNIGLLEYIAHHGGRGRLINENNIVTVITKDTEFYPGEGKYISLIPIGTVTGVTLENLKYPLWEAVLTFDNSIAVSNEFVGKSATVRLKEGSLIVIMSDD